MKFKRILSPSAITCYKHDENFKFGCPRKYFLKYIKKLKEKPKLVFIIGSIVHSVAEDYTKSFTIETLDQPYSNAKDDVIKLLGDKWKQQENQINMLALNTYHKEYHYAESRKMVINWLNQFIKEMSRGRSPPETERRIVNHDYGIQGIIDAKFNGNEVEIRDYKTGKHKKISHDIKLQLAIYSLLHFEEAGKLPDKVSIHFLKFPPAFDNPKIFKPTPELVEWAKEEIQKMHEIIQSEDESDYPCLCGGWCEKSFEK